MMENQREYILLGNFFRVEYELIISYRACVAYLCGVRTDHLLIERV